MYRRLVNVVGATALALLLPLGVAVGLTVREPAMVTIDAEPATRNAHARGAVSDNVLVISIDGLRPDAIEKYRAVVMMRLMREGAAAHGASTISLSKTLPSHMSMLTGVSPEVHRITWNDDSTDARGAVGVPTIFELAKNAGFTTAAFFSKPKLKHLLKRGTLDYASGPSRRRRVRAEETVEAATEHMLTDRPNLVFVHIGEPDWAGHDAGWMSARYGRAVVRADAAVGQLLTAAEQAYGAGKYSVIVTADHGGEGRSHNNGRAADLLIPWIAWGAGVQPSAVQAPVKTMDTAATVLWLLGVDRPVVWAGRAVTPAYTSSAQYAATHSTPHVVRARRSSRTPAVLGHGS